MDAIMDNMKNLEEPEWLERKITGDLRLWQVMFLCLAAFTALIVMVCCCFRFRIPRTKQQIEADYQRRKITTKFRQQLETIHDAKMDAMSLNDEVALTDSPVDIKYSASCTLALELLHEKTKSMEENNGSQQSSMASQQQSSLEAPCQQEGQKPEPQVSGSSFVKFATKVSLLSKLGGKTVEPTPPPSGNKMDV